tara:strand:+ start:14446 stop:18120 length:3675 start_codon:yes stop_codon:yes gene_type:complete
MPTATVKLTDGRTVTLQVKEGTSEAEISQAVTEYLSKGQPQLKQTQPDKSPKFGGIVAGMGTEIGLGATGKYGGAALGTAIAPGVGTAIGYGVGALSSGIMGSIAAQKMEGRDTISWGRAISAGLINLIPATEVSKAAIKSGKVIKEAAKIGAIEGGITGAAEAQLTSIIDKRKLGTLEDTATYGIIGAGLGAGLGAGIKALIKKSRGKTPAEIDEAVAHNDITKNDVVEASTANLEGETIEAVIEAKKQVERSRNHFISGNAINDIQNNTNLSTGWLTKVYKSLPPNVRTFLAKSVPSLPVGRRIADVSNAYENSIRSAEATGERVDKAIKQKLKTDPDAESKLNNFLDGGELSDDLKDIEGALTDYRNELYRQQEMLLIMLDDDMITGLTKKQRIELANKIQGSMQNGTYVTREYRLFVDKNYSPEQNKINKAKLEIAKNHANERAQKQGFKTAAVTKDDTEYAENYVESLLQKSAKQRAADPQGGARQPIDRSLKSRMLDPTADAALMDMLGVITEPGERARGTITSISKMVARQQTENEIEQILLSIGMAKTKRGGDFQTVLSTKTGKKEIYVEPETQLAINRLYADNSIKEFGNALVDGSITALNVAIGTSKATKVLFNMPSYFVQVYGNAATLMQLGYSPFKPMGADSILRVAGGDIDFFADPKKATKQLLEKIREAEKYGIKGTNVVESDIRANFEKGFGPVDKLINPAAKLYALPDTYFRYIGWLKTQESLKKIYKNADPENIKRAAALLINDTYQNYTKLNRGIRTATKYGVMPQFASFTAEFARNQYYQGKHMAQLFQGTYASDLGINLGPADTSAMKAEFAKRATGTAVVFGSIIAAQKGIEAAYGVSPEMKNAFIESGAPDYDKNSPMLVSQTDNGKNYGYMNMSYIAPQALIMQAFKQGFDGTDETNMRETLYQEFIGKGSFFGKALYETAYNTSLETGKKLSYKPDKLEALKEAFFMSMYDTFKPGQAREIEKFIKAYRGKGPFKIDEVYARQIGYRVNKGSIDDAFRFVARDTYDNAKSSKSAYKTLLRYGADRGMLQSEIESEYPALNKNYQDVMQIMMKHNRNYEIWGRGEDERIDIFKNAGVSSKDILYILSGEVPDLAIDLTQSTAEVIDSFGFDFKDKSQANKEAIKNKIKSEVQNPAEARKYMNYIYRSFKKSNYSGRDRLLNGLNKADQIDFLESRGYSQNRAYLMELKNKGVISQEVFDRL